MAEEVSEEEELRAAFRQERASLSRFDLPLLVALVATIGLGWFRGGAPGAMVTVLVWMGISRVLKRRHDARMARSPAARALYDRGFVCGLPASFYRQRFTELVQGSSAPLTLIYMGGVGLPHGGPVWIHIQLDRAASSGRLDLGKGPIALPPDAVAELEPLLAQFLVDPRSVPEEGVDGMPCELVIATSHPLAVHRVRCNACDSLKWPAVALARALARLNDRLSGAAGT